MTIDAVAVRFSTPDTGGGAAPKFITERLLSFEARLYALEEDPQGTLQQRHIRAAVDAHIAEEILGALASSVANERAADAATITKTADLLRAAIVERAGGRAAIERAERLDGIDPRETTAIFERKARAAIYIDRAITPILVSTEDQLRETYRTTSHPYRNRHFEDCRDELARWVVIERFRSAEQSYLQTARSRVNAVFL